MRCTLGADVVTYSARLSVTHHSVVCNHQDSSVGLQIGQNALGKSEYERRDRNDTSEKKQDVGIAKEQAIQGGVFREELHENISVPSLVPRF